MDIATATGMRITVVRTIRLPADGKLRFRSSKKGKWGEFVVADSPVLSALVERRLAMKAHSVMLLVSDTGRQVSERMLVDRWDDARGAAAKAHPSSLRPSWPCLTAICASARPTWPATLMRPQSCCSTAAQS